MEVIADLPPVAPAVDGEALEADPSAVDSAAVGAVPDGAPLAEPEAEAAVPSAEAAASAVPAEAALVEAAVDSAAAPEAVASADADNNKKETTTRKSRGFLRF